MNDTSSLPYRQLRKYWQLTTTPAEAFTVVQAAQKYTGATAADGSTFR